MTLEIEFYHHTTPPKINMSENNTKIHIYDLIYEVVDMDVNCSILYRKFKKHKSHLGAGRRWLLPEPKNARPEIYDRWDTFDGPLIN